MKIPIKHEFFKKIEKGIKKIELREAHLTFIDEKTGKQLTQKVADCGAMPKVVFDNFKGACISKKEFNRMFKEDKIIVFELE